MHLQEMILKEKKFHFVKELGKNRNKPKELKELKEIKDFKVTRSKLGQSNTIKNLS